MLSTSSCFEILRLLFFFADTLLQLNYHNKKSNPMQLAEYVRLNTSHSTHIPVKRNSIKSKVLKLK